MTDKRYTEKQNEISTFAKALAHPSRVAVIEFLLKRNSCFFGDINEELPIAKATVSQHLKELKNAGLIKGDIEGPKVKYCIDKEKWEEARKLFNCFFENKVCSNSCSGKK